MMIYYVVLGVGILAGIAGQMLLKAGADAPTLVTQILRPSTLCGLALYGSAAFLYIFALRTIPCRSPSQACRFPMRSWRCSAISCSASRLALSRSRHRAHHGRRGVINQT